ALWEERILSRVIHSFHQYMNSCELDACCVQTYYRGTRPHSMPALTRPKTSTKKKHAANGHSTDDIVIPDKLYFRIGEVARLCDLPAYVLRFWETEFPQLSPKKSSKGQRLYRQRDVESLVRIKKLLYEEGFTISGARQHLKLEAKPAKSQATLLSTHRARPTDLKR